MPQVSRRRSTFPESPGTDAALRVRQFWGDGVSDVDLRALLAFHRSHGKLATVTAVRPPARYGHMVFDGARVTRFAEKPQAAEGWINGAFFVLEPKVLDFLAAHA